jgi:hypothetical protein
MSRYVTELLASSRESWAVEPSELVTIELSEQERTVLQEGLGQWGGPAFCTPELARAIGFASLGEVRETAARIRASLQDGSTLSRLDWFRALASTEIGFGSDIFGAGVEWSMATGLSDSESLVTLRSLQRKLIGVVAGLVRTEDATGGR